MNRARALSQLSVCLRGQIPPNADWPAILSLANDALITPGLYPLLAGDPTTPPEAPEEVRAFLAEVYKRNLARNANLFDTLKDALAALNAGGIEPVLLKGCGTWIQGNGVAAEPPNGDRLVSDLDLLVKPSEGRRAVDALKQAGFLVLEDHGRDNDQVVAILGRSQDAGTIDLHDRPPCPVGVPELDHLHDHSEFVCVGPHKAKLPRPELQILVASLHDHIHDGGYWMGGFQLRHLMDISKLTRCARKIDWAFLLSICSNRFIRLVLEIQLLAAKRLAGAEVPGWLVSRGRTRAEYYRLTLQHDFPAINVPLVWLGRLIRWRHLPSRTRLVGASCP